MRPSSPTRLTPANMPPNRLSQLRRMRSNTGAVSASELLMAARTSAEARLLVERLLGLVPQAHVLDRDHGLVRKRRQQRELANR